MYTTAGKIDGHINYTEYIELIAEHPIVEMLLTPQYQGLARDKVFDEETLRVWMWRWTSTTRKKHSGTMAQTRRNYVYNEYNCVSVAIKYRHSID